jgi:hypothetical protein
MIPLLTALIAIAAAEWRMWGLALPNFDSKGQLAKS